MNWKIQITWELKKNSTDCTHQSLFTGFEKHHCISKAKLPQCLLGLKPTSLKMKITWGCGVRKKYVYQTSVPHEPIQRRKLEGPIKPMLRWSSLLETVSPWLLTVLYKAHMNRSSSSWWKIHDNRIGKQTKTLGGRERHLTVPLKLNKSRFSWKIIILVTQAICWSMFFREMCF